MEFTVGGLAARGSNAEAQMLSLLQEILHSTSGICSYRFPPVGIGSLENVPSFVIYGPEIGIVLLDVVDVELDSENVGEEYWQTVDGTQIPSREFVLDQYASEIKTRIRTDARLVDRKKDRFKFPVNRIIVFYRNSAIDVQSLSSQLDLVSDARSASTFHRAISTTDFIKPDEAKLSPDAYASLVSLLESTSVYRRVTKSSLGEQTLTTKSDFIRRAMDVVFKLDDEQRRISWQMPEGPQRIRGLAGTGKTVILSLKAAYAHHAYPGSNILVTFHTQSLYRNFENLITKYYAKEARSTPDWTHLSIMHAWGSQSKLGVYRALCNLHGLKPIGLREIPPNINKLEYIYKDLLSKIKHKLEPIYDLILIDEAQDLPPAVFETLYLICKAPKRLVWAYDEFQSLTDVNIKEPDQLFGLAQNGSPNLSTDDLRGEYPDGIKKDYVLRNSYRNPRRVLTTAHGIALGLHRQGGAIDMLPDAASWRALGYDVVKPLNETQFEQGDVVTVQRPEQYSLNTLEILLRQHRGVVADRELIQFSTFEDSREEDRFIVDEISRLITKEGIDPEQIVVISLGFRTLETDLLGLRKLLSDKGVQSIVPGFVESSNIFAVPGSVTLCAPLRAKGNEAHVVFVTRSQRTTEDALFRARNAMFVALTRASGWCYVTGHGSGMAALTAELEQLDASYPQITFVVPNQQLVNLRRSIISGAERQLDEQDEMLTNILRENPALVIDRLLQRPDLLPLLQPKKDASELT